MTYPLIGNYGVPNIYEKDEYGLCKNAESEKIHVSNSQLLLHPNKPQAFSNDRSLALAPACGSGSQMNNDTNIITS